MENVDPTVAELGEVEALKRAVAVFRRAPSTLVGSGDDAAVVAVEDGRFVVTTDTMVEYHDFRRDFSTAFDLGYKAVASNVADVAAMGAVPNALVVAMVIPPATKQSWLEDFAKGLQEGIDQLAPAAEVVGGDLASGSQIVISVTAHGHLEGREPILRSGAKVGDVVAVAGTLGRAACGLDLLFHEDATLAKAYDEWASVQRRPQPPVSLGPVAANTATSMLDVSDSLTLDATRIAKASTVSIKLNKAALEGYAAVLELAQQSMTARDGIVRSAMDWVLFGGEDHALLATFPAGSEMPKGFKIIGEVIAQTSTPLYLDQEPLTPMGWDSIKG